MYGVSDYRMIFLKFPWSRKWEVLVQTDNNKSAVESRLSAPWDLSPLTCNSPCWSAQAPSSHRNRLPKFPVGKSAAAEAGRRAAHFFSAADSSWYCGADQKVLTKGWKINSSFKALMGYLGKNGKNMAKFSFNCSPYVTEKKLCFECKQNKCLLSIDFFLVSFSHCADEGAAFHGPASMQGWFDQDLVLGIAGGKPGTVSGRAPCAPAAL